MRIRVFAVLTLVFGLVFVLAWSASAQGPEPDAHDGTLSFAWPAIPNPTSPRSPNAAVPVGQSGLSYRYVQTFGHPETAYFEDSTHLNYPSGLAIDGTNVWIADSLGMRALKFNGVTGIFLTQIGKAGFRESVGVNGTSLDNVAGVAVDSGGNIWLVDQYSQQVLKFNSSGTYQSKLGQTFSGGSDNAHFSLPFGIAFDSSGNSYVSDSNNHRIQVFNSSGAYSLTIGLTGIPTSTNAGFNAPHHIAIDSSDNLYVADGFNNRVQIFDPSHAYSATLGTGVSGSGNNQFNKPFGIFVDTARIYVADQGNNRVQIFDRLTRAYLASLGTGSPGTGNNQFNSPWDVAVDSAGNIYVADFGNARVQQFDSGLNYMRTYGTTGVPYLTDNYHYFRAMGVAVALDGSIYLSEERGQRLIKLNAAGVAQWAVGEAGVAGLDNNHFSNPAALALDSAGRVYVDDGGNNRIQIFNPDGSFYNTFGSGYGSGNYNFKNPSGLFIAPDDSLYVTDMNNQRVQIYNSSHIYMATLGITGASASDNAHFNSPRGVTVDANGVIYVSDTNNQRVQVFNSSYIYQRTIGVTGVIGNDYGHFFGPQHLLVDSRNDLMVADCCNNRIQIFDHNGAYLSTIGGSYGNGTGQLRNPFGIAFDRAGNLYAADSLNHRIQKYAPGVPGWRQSNVNGFGDRENRIVSTLAPFGGQLYAGTWNTGAGGAQLWRSANGTNWTPVITNGFGITRNIAINLLLEFNGQLYAATVADQVNGGEVWRSSDGLGWTRVVTAGFGDPTNAQVHYLAVFNNQLYASTQSYTGAHGAEIWRSSTGDGGDWAPVVSNGFNSNANNQAVTAMQVFSGALYAETDNGITGAEVWASSTGNSGTWIPVSTAGFGEGANNNAMSGFAVFNGQLYAGAVNCTDGGEVWRSADGTGWTKVVDTGLDDPKNCSMDSMRAFDGNLYLTTDNQQKGLQVWRTANGTTWTPVSPKGFGDSNTVNGYWSNSAAIFNGHLFLGTSNFPSGGGKIWQMLQNIYLPLIER